MGRVSLATPTAAHSRPDTLARDGWLLAKQAAAVRMRGAARRGGAVSAAEQAAPPLRPDVSCWADAWVLLRRSASAGDRRPLRSSSPRPPQRACLRPPVPRRWLPYAGPAVTAAAWCASPTENSAKRRCSRRAGVDTGQPPPLREPGAGSPSTGPAARQHGNRGGRASRAGQSEREVAPGEDRL